MRRISVLTVMSLLGIQAFAQGQVQIPEYLLENEAVHSYLTQVQYDPNDYTTSRIMEFCDPYPWDWANAGGYRKDHPLPVPVKLAAAVDTISKLYVSETEDYSDAQTKIMNVFKGTDSINIYNLIPGRLYNWKLESPQRDGSQKVVANGQFKTTGKLRQLKVDNVFNVRDMGGWEGLKGYPVRYGRIIRGSRLNVNGSTTKIITDAGIEELLWAGVRAELDMRDQSNAPMPSGESRHSYLGSAYPIYNVDQGYRSRIATFADAPQSIMGIKKLIEWFKEDKPVYLHCSVGADRTGTVAFLVGALCGMSEDALSKEFELTSFSGDWIENEKDRGHSERLVRQRNYVGRLDPNDNNESYKYAKMIDKVKTFPGNTIQEKVYYHLKTGVQGNYIPEADLEFLINYMLNPIDMNVSGTVRMNKGVSKQVEAKMVTHSELNPDAQITFTSSDPRVATVDETGLVTAIAGGTTTISATVDGFSKKFTVNVPLVESELPDSVYFGADTYSVSKSTNAVVNGSFEYADRFNSWKSATGGALSDQYFEVAQDAQTGETYLVCKASGDASSPKSIRMEWALAGNKTFVLGFRIKNTSGQKVDANANLQVSLIRNKPEIDASADDFVWDTDPATVIRRVDSRMDATLSGDFLIFNEKPSYDGDWTEVQYVFCNPSTDRYRYLQLLFTNLGDANDKICLDNIYLAEIKFVHGTNVEAINEADANAPAMYNLNGQKTDSPSGIIIMNGKKYLLK